MSRGKGEEDRKLVEARREGRRQSDKRGEWKGKKRKRKEDERRN